MRQKCILNFEMSENEYNFAKENSDKYMVIFVANVQIGKEISLKDIHPLPFNFLSSESFYIKPTNYQIFLIKESE